MGGSATLIVRGWLFPLVIHICWTLIVGKRNGTQICGGNGYFGGGSYISLFADSDRYPGGAISSSITTSSSTTISSPTTSGGTGTTNPTPTPTGPIDNPGDSNFGFLGCYTEGTSGRALSVLTASDTMTVDTCLGICNSYQYAGLEYARECWCGNTLGAGSAPTLITQCRMTCKGNRCRGSWKSFLLLF